MKILGEPLRRRAPEVRSRLASGYPLHHPRRRTRTRGALRVGRVVPLLSLSLLRRSAANQKYEIRLKILKNQCHLCAKI
jgi:hypothetical protein